MKNFILFTIGLAVCVQVFTMRAWATSIFKKVPPLEERVKAAKMIFVGTPMSERPMDAPSESMNMVVSFKVDRVFKGDPGKTIEIYYLKLGPNLTGVEIGEYTKLHVRQSYEGAITRGIPELVYAQERDGRLFTSPKIGGGTTQMPSIQKEIEKLSAPKVSGKRER